MSKLRQQIEAWRDSYINITLKNNMLNREENKSKAIRFTTNEHFTYEHFWKIAIGEGGMEDYALRSGANSDPRYNPIGWRSVKPMDNPTDPAVLDDLVKTGYDVIVKKGENPLCLSFGRLDWRVQNPDFTPNGKEEEFITISSPIILIPIKLNKQGVNYWIKPVDDEAIINPALLLRYKAEGYKSLPMPECGQWIDTKSFDIAEYFDALADHFSGSTTCSFDCDDVTLDIFDYNRLCMYRDVSRHIDDIERNPVIRMIFGENSIPAASPVGIDNEDPTKSFPIVDADSSQNAVIEHFRAGESFIMEGPPGTGKTQTIMNLISDALMRNKRVLFVSSKMSALITLNKKMKMAGVNLDKHCLLIKGESENLGKSESKANLADTYGKLKAALEAPAPAFDFSKYAENIQEYLDTRNTLVGYNKEFYSKDNTLGMSVYDIIGRMLLLGYDEKSIMPLENLGDIDIEELTKDELNSLVKPMRDLQTLSLAIISRFGGIEKDVWFGLRDTELSQARENILRSRIAEMTVTMQDLKSVISSCTGGDEKLIKNLLSALFESSLSTVISLLDADFSRDLYPAYTKSGMSEERRILEKEIANRERYAASVARYYSICAEGAVAAPDAVKELLKNSLHWQKLTLQGVREEQSRLKRVKPISQNDAITDISSDIKAMEALVEDINNLVNTKNELSEIKNELLSHFTEEIFELNYMALLSKFRTSWQENLKQNRKPLLFDMQISKMKKCCCDAQNVNFDMATVYGFLEKLDLYSKKRERVEELAKTLSAYGIVDTNLEMKQLINLAEYLSDFIREALDHKLRGVMFKTGSFEEYIAEKAEALDKINEAAKLLMVERDITVGELSAIAEYYKRICEENARISATEGLDKIFPSIEKNVRTNWAGILDLINLIDRARDMVRDENRTLDEDYAAFVDVIKFLSQGGVKQYVTSLVEQYRSFYSDDSFFDFEVMGDSHDVNSMNYKNFEEWFSHINDFNTLAQYAAYRKSVDELDTMSRSFFEKYARRGRREYPLDQLANQYELSILYTYYGFLLTSSKYVAKLSGRDGITTIQSIMDSYQEADKRLIEDNRRVLDTTLYQSITRSAFGGNSLHNYLHAVPSGSNVSIRRLFKNRSESIKELAPCMMMSIYSVSKLLEYEKYKFDVVIFDEASQIPAEDALPALMRATSQVVIAGDPKQMPAIEYFAEKNSFEHIDADDEDEVGEDLSILDFIITAPDNRLGSARLNMHYRSNHESLIKYSNEHPKLYAGNLITFPSPIARSEDFGLTGIFVPDDPEFAGKKIIGGKGQNEAEAKIAIRLIKEHFRKHPAPKTEEEIEKFESLGVIVFGTHQKDMLLSMMAKDPEAAKIAAITDNRVFFITPADEVQGDEMATMILSLTYGRDKDGEHSNFWGHMNQVSVALRKFNVAVTRAKNNLKFIHTVRANEIAGGNLSYIADYIRGIDALGDNSFVSHPEYNTTFVEAVGKICEEIIGDKSRVVYNYGDSVRSYRIPICILSADKKTVALGIMCEVNRAADNLSVREYARTCPSILKAHGWDNLHTTYALQWVRNYSIELLELKKQLEKVR